MKKNLKTKLNVIDLFSGCGGLSYGFIQSGYNVILGVDNDERALETFKKNHKESKVLNADLSDKRIIRETDRIITGKSVDVIIGGPPCQGFSLTGPRKFDDKRNKLYLAVFDFVKHYVPKAFLIENVPGLTRLFNGKIKDEIIKRFDDLGYNVSDQLLCAADYGVPQMRKRVFFVGLRKEFGRFIFPAPTHIEINFISCKDAISDLPSLTKDFGEEIGKYNGNPSSDYQKTMRKKCSILYNHVATRHTDHVKSVISQVPDGGDYKDLPEGVGDSRKFNEAWTRYNSKRPSHTIDTGHRNHFHYKYDRVPTVRENARLQSFPDDFIFCGPRTSQHRQVGNAVPPLLGKHIGLKIAEYIK